MYTDFKSTNCGVLFIAFGDQYMREVVCSITSLRQFHPTLPCCVISDKRPNDLPSGVQVLMREPPAKYPLRTKPLYLGDSPFDRTLFLDTDTTIVRPIENIFLLLDRFDVGLHLLQYYKPDRPFICMANSGVIVYRRSTSVDQMFKRWLELFDELVILSERQNPAVHRKLTD